MNVSREEILARRVAALQARRARGRSSYVWRYGVLLFGSIRALFMTSVVYWFLRGFYPPFMPQGIPRFLAWLLVFAPAGAMAGVLWGRSMWTKLEANNWYLPPEQGHSSSRSAI